MAICLLLFLFIEALNTPNTASLQRDFANHFVVKTCHEIKISFQIRGIFKSLVLGPRCCLTYCLWEMARCLLRDPSAMQVTHTSDKTMPSSALTWQGATFCLHLVLVLVFSY